MDLRQLKNVPDLARNLTSKQIIVPAGTVVQVTTPKIRDRQIVIIRNVGKETVFLGNSDVDSTKGFPLFGNEVIVLPSKKEVFAYAEKDTELRVLEG